jgi:FKBP-type peptidyl-prolyl cis-trans isomerase
VQYEDVEIGGGEVVDRDSTVEVIYSVFLNRGDVVQRDVRYSFRPAERNVVPGLAYGVEGMRVGGKRRIRVAPHLGYRETGVPEQVPANAVLICEVSVLGTRKESRQSVGKSEP